VVRRAASQFSGRTREKRNYEQRLFQCVTVSIRPPLASESPSRRLTSDDLTTERLSYNHSSRTAHTTLAHASIKILRPTQLIEILSLHTTLGRSYPLFGRVITHPFFSSSSSRPSLVETAVLDTPDAASACAPTLCLCGFYRLVE
jgi:hypothetical protein